MTNPRHPRVCAAISAHYSDKKFRYTAELEFAGIYSTLYNHGTPNHLGYVAVYWVAEVLEDYFGKVASGDLEPCWSPDVVYTYLEEAFQERGVEQRLAERILEETRLGSTYVNMFGHGTPGAVTYEVLAALRYLFLSV